MRKEQVFKDSYKSESGKKRAPKIRAPFSTEMRFTGMKGQSGVSDAEWDRRQEALGIPIDLDVLEMHEIVFMERFKNDWGQHFVWIPKDDKTLRPTNDFYWGEKEAKVELKAFQRPTEAKVFGRIRNAVRSANDKHVTKDCFMVDLTGVPPKQVGKLFNQLSKYNIAHPGEKISHLYIASDGGKEYKFDNQGHRMETSIRPGIVEVNLKNK